MRGNEKIPSVPHRLEKIASAVPVCRSAADVGTDHALLPVYLVKTGKAETVYAGDLRKGPLEAAARTVSAYCAADRVKLILCDGLSGIIGYRPDTIVIAGMGGETISGILEMLENVPGYAPKLVLQPMSKPEKLREYLIRGPFCIERETLCSEDGRIYDIIEASVDPERREIPRTEDVYCGRHDLSDEETRELYGAYLSSLSETFSVRAAGMKKSAFYDRKSAGTYEELIKYVSGEIKRINETE